ncbi:ABC transporter ATP-binding protein [Elioraea sp.]|uniref:ABC transporter ATP-binding protein n=1 Tax=Elioraea sp. TaxID=2185103 RepID=UPI0025B7CA35|nr:ABC transporter ATP-binding protein [Elioraea sp.]
MSAIDQMRQAVRASLEVRGLTKAYSSEVSVGPISFDVREGEFFSLLGPSGCGKTTTLRCIAGFERPTGGEILLGGARLDTVPAHRRDLGLVFQSHALFPHLTVAENVGFGLSVRKVEAAERRRRVADALALVGLADLGSRWPQQISGGQQQRVALARSLVLRPPLLLLDEPLSSLDLKLRQQMREELRRLQKQLGQTTVFVTHDQTEALAMSDRLAVLSGGRIEQIGTPEQIYRRPTTRFVAGFIGQANILDATIAVRGDDGVAGLRVAGPDGVVLRVRLGEGSGAVPPPGSAAAAVIRPEDVVLGDDGPDAENTFRAQVRDIEYLGEDTQVTLEAPGLPPLLASFKTTRTASARLAARGSGTLRVRIDAADIHLIPG